VVFDIVVGEQKTQLVI
jgi:hypothetical protein